MGVKATQQAADIFWIKHWPLKYSKSNFGRNSDSGSGDSYLPWIDVLVEKIYTILKSNSVRQIGIY